MRNSTKLIVGLLALLMLSGIFSLARAEQSGGDGGYPEWALSGRAFADLYVPTREKRGYTFQQLSTSLWLQGDARFSEAWSARAIYQGDFYEGKESRVTGNRSGTNARHRPREAYLEYFARGFQMRAGKQIIAWGKSDGINLTDYLSAKQTDTLNHDSEVLRDAGIALLFSYTPGDGSSPWTYTLVGQPWFPTADYLVPPAAQPSFVTFLEKEKPKGSIENTEAAAKVAYAGTGWDASVSAFRGFDHKPFFAVNDVTLLSPTAASVRVKRVFHRVKAAGVDASYSSGDWVHRLESAYSWTENDDGRNPLITPSHWDAVIGTERPFLEKFRAQAQFISRYFPRWSDPATAGGSGAVGTAINQQIAAANALLQQYQAKWEAAGTLRGSYSHEASGFTAELLWYQGFTHGDYYLQPLLSYPLKESLRLYLGYDHYGGPANKSIGSLQSYNAVFTEVKWTF